MYNEKLKRDYTIIVKSMMRGIGFYANMDNKRSHDIIEKSFRNVKTVRSSWWSRCRWYYW